MGHPGEKFNLGGPKFLRIFLSDHGRNLSHDDGTFFYPYSRLSLNGHLYKTDTSVKRTPRVGPCPCLFPLFDSL